VTVATNKSKRYFALTLTLCACAERIGSQVNWFT